MAQRLDRAADVATIIPSVSDARPFRLSLCDGADQVAREVADHGWDSFERPFPTVLSALVRSSLGRTLVVDVGSNTGYYALLTTAIDSTARVVAFEPYPPVAAMLHANVALNRMSSRVDVVERALGCDAGVATLFVPSDVHGLIETSCSLNPEFSIRDLGTSVQVEVTTLDDYFRDSSVRPSLVKIDVESMEHEVLAGATSVLSNDRPVVILEVLPSTDPAPLEHLRARHRYVDVRLHSERAIVAAAVEADGQGWNHLWAPTERLEEIVGLLRSCDLDIIRYR